MNKAEILGLALRVEALEGADRVVGLEIMCALDVRPAWLNGSEGHMWLDTACPNPVVRWCDHRMKEGGGNPSVDDGLRYTSSIDAAMGLVPEGWDWCLSMGVGEYAEASLAPAMKVTEHHGTGISPALALTAAALRAIASTMEDDRG